jgi:transcriptional regulator of heat shock response
MLTARQRKLLKIIIDEFIDTAEAVGSLNISDKYDLDVSPATIRNEMARLSDLGLLEKEHASAGRRPTSEAIKWFLDEMLDDFEELDVLITTGIRENMFQRRFDVDRLLSEAVKSLAGLSQNTALVMLHGRRYVAGLSEMVDQPEFTDMKKLKKILLTLEDYDSWSALFNRFDRSDDVNILVGAETGIEQFGESAVAFAHIKVHGNEHGYIAVVGPNRMNYRRVIPAIKYIVNVIQDSVLGW